MKLATDEDKDEDKDEMAKGRKGKNPMMSA